MIIPMPLKSCVQYTILMVECSRNIRRIPTLRKKFNEMETQLENKSPISGHHQ